MGQELNAEKKDSGQYSSAFSLKTEGRGEESSEYLQVGEERKANKKVMMKKENLRGKVFRKSTRLRLSVTKGSWLLIIQVF